MGVCEIFLRLSLVFFERKDNMHSLVGTCVMGTQSQATITKITYISSTSRVKKNSNK